MVGKTALPRAKKNRTFRSEVGCPITIQRCLCMMDLLLEEVAKNKIGGISGVVEDVIVRTQGTEDYISREGVQMTIKSRY